MMTVLSIIGFIVLALVVGIVSILIGMAIFLTVLGAIWATLHRFRESLPIIVVVATIVMFGFWVLQVLGSSLMPYLVHGVTSWDIDYTSLLDVIDRNDTMLKNWIGSQAIIDKVPLWFYVPMVGMLLNWAAEAYDKEDKPPNTTPTKAI